MIGDGAGHKLYRVQRLHLRDAGEVKKDVAFVFDEVCLDEPQIYRTPIPLDNIGIKHGADIPSFIRSAYQVACTMGRRIVRCHTAVYEFLYLLKVLAGQ